MANIKYSELLDDVLPSLSADPSDPVTEHAIKRTVIEFCSKTWIWKQIPDAIDVIAGESAYTLEPPAATDISVVMAALHGNVPLENRNTAWLDSQLPDWRTTRAVPKYFTQVDTEQILLAAVPDSSLRGGLTLTVALQPSQNSTGFPKWIFNQYLYALTDGVLARLMLMPNKPWSDPNEGHDRRARFQAAMANARANAAGALGRAPQRAPSQH